MLRSSEIQNIITVKLQAVQIIHETAHERIMDILNDIRKLSSELHEIESGAIEDKHITL